MTVKKAWGLLKETYNEWSQDNVSRLAAALAYYTVFSLAPLLVVVIAIVGIVANRIWGPGAAEREVSKQAHDLVGPRGAEFIGTLVQNAALPGSGLAMVVGIVLLLYGATNVFASLQDSLNTIWEVKSKPGQGVLQTVRQRVMSFAMVLGIAFLLMVSLVISAALSAATKYVGGDFPSVLWRVVELAISLGLFTVIFGAIYKVLPDVKIAWRPVWVGAAMTAVLLTVGKYLIGMYLGRSTTTSVYGAAGSLVILLLWVYYASQIAFIGAEFTQVYAKSKGYAIRPSSNAVSLTEVERVHQGMPHAERVREAVEEDEDRHRDVVRVPVRVGRSAYLAAAGLVAGFVVGRTSRLIRSREHAVREAATRRLHERVRRVYARLKEGEDAATCLREVDARERLDLLERRVKRVTESGVSV